MTNCLNFWFIVVIIVSVNQRRVEAKNCDNYFHYDLGAVRTVASGTQLEREIRRVETQDLIQVRGDVIELQVLNGTHWLNLGGNVETFEAVIAVPPETSSQVTLLQALTKLNQTSDPAGNIKALIQFQPKTLSSSYLHILQQFSKTLPIWVSGETSQSGVMPVLDLEKPYGLDDVFRRIQAENILLPYDFNRLKSILHEAFAAHSVEGSQKVYLKRKYKHVKRNHMNSFTELFMNNMVHLLENLKDMESNGIQFLPDLQKAGESCSLQDFDEILKKDDDQCTIVRIRAGVFLKSECLATLTQMLENHSEKFKPLIYAYPYDATPIKDLTTALNVIGRDNVLLDLPSNHFNLRIESQFSDEPKNDRKLVTQNSGFLVKSSYLNVVVILAVILFLK